MTTTKRWIVRSSGFPFATPGDPIGTVTADDRDVARRLAAEVYGPKVVVEPETDTLAADPFPYKNPLKDQAAALVHASRAMRGMTAIEVQMARAVGVLKVGSSSKQYRGTIRRLHAETFKPQPQISDDLATLLRAIVQATASQLPRELVESVGGGS
jgi:hypothetical protein